MLTIISTIAAMQFSLVVIATFPYILVGNRIDFSGGAQYLFGIFCCLEVIACVAGPMFGINSGNPVITAVGVVDAALIIWAFVVYYRDLKDRQNKRKCAVITDWMSDFFEQPKFEKRTGFVMPWRVGPVLELTSMEFPDADTFVEGLREQGYSTVTLDCVDQGGPLEIVNRVLADLEERGEKLDDWTAGSIRNVYDDCSYHFFAFKNHQNATQFRLTYT